jgi:TRAP-type C4-dicarboxylate transport system permease small subunit
MRQWLSRLDRRVFRIERALVVASLVVMSVVVFLDVVHRTFADPESKLVQWIVSLGGIAEDTPAHATVQEVAPWLLFAFFVWLAYFALRTARMKKSMPRPRAAVLAVVGVLVAYGLVRLLIELNPNGFIWSQPLALMLVLWVGFVGASMCTHEGRHLKVEAIERHLPQRIRPKVVFVSQVLTAAFCLFLFWVSSEYVAFNYEEWSATEGRGGLLKGIDIPKWAGFSVLPIAFLIMTARFIGAAFAALRGEIQETNVLAGMASVAAEAREPPSRVPTEVAVEPLPSSVPTVGVTPLPSTVPTEMALPAQNPADIPEGGADEEEK